MANNGEIDLIAGQKAFDQLDKLILKTEEANREMLDLVDSALKLNKNLASIVTPKGLNDLVANNEKLSTEMQKQNATIQALQAKITTLTTKQNTNTNSIKKNVQAILDQAKSYQSLDKQRQKAIAQSEKEAAALLKAENVYNKIQLKINGMVPVYNNLQAKQKLGLTLSAREEAQLTVLSNRLTKYQGILKETDIAIGRHQREVGNYAKGNANLSASINQISRELPNFGQSFSVGVLSLTNNVGALLDSTKQVIAQNKILKAEGKETTSVLRQVLGSIMSWQTVLFVGIGLLSAYSKEISDWVKELTKGKESISELQLRIETLNKAFEESSVQNVVKNINELSINIDLAKRGFLDKEKVVEQYNETIGKTTGLVDTLDEAERELTKNGEAYIKMTLYKAAANLALESAAIATLKAEQTRRKELEEFSQWFLDADLTQTRSQEQYNLKQQSLRTQREKRQKEEIKVNEDAAKANINIAKKFQEDAAKIATAYNFNLFDDNKKEEAKEARREDIEGLKSHFEKVGTLVDEINKEIDRLRTEQIVGDPGEIGAVNFQLEMLLKLRTQLNELPHAEFKILGVPEGKKQVEEIKNLTDEMKKYLKSFVDDFSSNIGFKETFKLLNGEIEGFGENFAVTFNAIAETAQEAFNFITNASQQNFDKEYERLETQKDIAIGWAGESAEARAKIEDDFEKKRRDIATREAKAKKKQALMNIAIDTAQAIVGLWVNPGFPSAIPLAIGVGALGLAQAAIVNAQQIPQYFRGTDNHPGGPMIINDGSGPNFKETVVTPDGKINQYEGRNLLMSAPAGTKVFTHDQFKKQLDNQLFSNEINYSPHNDSGINKNDLQALKTGIVNAIQNKKEFSLSIDKRGFNTTIIDGNIRRTILNNEINSIGIKV